MRQAIEAVDNLDLTGKLNLAQVALDIAKAKWVRATPIFGCAVIKANFWKSASIGWRNRRQGSARAFACGYCSTERGATRAVRWRAEDEVRNVTARAIDVARASQPLQLRKFVLEDMPVYNDRLGHADEGRSLFGAD